MSPDRARRPTAATRAAALASLADRLQAGVFAGTLHRDGRTTTAAANPLLRRFLGYPDDAPDAAVDLFAVERFADAATREVVCHRLTDPSGLVDHPLKLLRQDGTTVWVEITGTAHRDAAGDLQVEALVRDVSHRRRQDDQSRDLHQQLVQADKMAALGQAISGVAHELNNPLATILSWAERLAERPLDPAARKGVDVILGEAERAARIVRNLLTFARKRQSTRAMVDVNDVVRDTLALRGPDQQAHEIAVRLELGEGLSEVFGDSYQFQQVLLNLVINAEQAMRGSRGRGTLTVRTLEGAESVLIEVEDDGPGVPTEARARIFDPFFTTKQVGEGTGLGLSVAYAIVQEHGGRISIDTAASGGALFRVDLPVSRLQQGGARRRATAAPSMEAVRGSAILLVEDEQALAMAVAEGLRDAGLSVTYAPDGEDALAHLARTRFDLVVCDLKMPKVDGFEVYRRLSARPSPPPIIFMTGDSADPAAGRFLAEPGRRWLAKPFRLNDLLTAVRDALAADPG